MPDITLTRGVTVLTLPEGLEWADRFQDPAIAGNTRRALTGRIISQTADLYLGRNITLRTAQMTGGYAGIFSLEEIDALKALHDLADTSMELVIASSTYYVRFHRDGDDRGLRVQPLFPPRAAGQDPDTDWFGATLRFYTVAAP